MATAAGLLSSKADALLVTYAPFPTRSHPTLAHLVKRSTPLGARTGEPKRQSPGAAQKSALTSGNVDRIVGGASMNKAMRIAVIALGFAAFTASSADARWGGRGGWGGGVRAGGFGGFRGGFGGYRGFAGYRAGYGYRRAGYWGRGWGYGGVGVRMGG